MLGVDFRAAGALRPRVGRVQSAKKNHVRVYNYRTEGVLFEIGYSRS